MFQGEFCNNMDSKGRVSIPAAFRDVLKSQYADERIVITRSPYQRYLVAYPMREWKRLQSRIANTPPSPELRAFKRVVISSAQEYLPDRQGRVLIPPGLREYAGMKRSIQFAGANEIFELWAKDHWDKQFEADLELAKKLDLGF